MASEFDTQNMPREMGDSFARLRLKFIDQIENRILDFEAALSVLRKGGQDISAVETLRFHSHNLSGLASSLGFAAVGVAATEAERLWVQSIEQNLTQRIVFDAQQATEKLLDLLEEVVEPQSDDAA